MHARGYTGRCVRDRGELFELAAAELRDRPVLYLEFGVYRGDSMRMWSRLLRHPDARLHGFDTFTGLPDPWNAFAGRGAYSTAGRVPDIVDRRVQFFKGPFEKTLPTYKSPTLEKLFINVDCDLYSSAKTVLDWAEPLLRPGSYVYFDEFSNRAHELRAFSEFLTEHTCRSRLSVPRRR